MNGVKNLYTLQFTNNSYYSTYYNKQILFGFHDKDYARSCRDTLLKYYNTNGYWMNQCVNMSRLPDKTCRFMLTENKKYKKTRLISDMYVNVFDLDDNSQCETVESIYNVTSANFLIVYDFQLLMEYKQLIIDGIYIEQDFDLNEENSKQYMDSLENIYKKNHE